MSEEWHNRYTEQALWTENIRNYLINKSGITEGDRILDVGCGTGVLIAEFEEKGLQYHGLDLSFSALRFARDICLGKVLLQGDGLSLPLKDNVYDFSFCHFCLMWIQNPGSVVKEMTRVTKSGGSVAAFAEPDYGGRIDYPTELAVLGKYQIEGLVQQGANPFIGRELATLFQDAELSSIQTGVLGGQWSETPNWKSWESEWVVIESDLRNCKSHLSLKEMKHLKEVDRKAYTNGKRILYVPTFYAFGVVD